MKKTLLIFTVFLVMIGVFFATTQIYAENKAIDEATESKIIELKDNASSSLADYQDKYGSNVYGLVAYILNLVRIYSIPLCFLGIAIGAKNGKAYQRNRAKRIIRECYSSFENNIKDGNSIVILMNKKFDIENIKFSEVLKDIENIFLKAEILKKEDEI